MAGIVTCFQRKYSHTEEEKDFGYAGLLQKAGRFFGTGSGGTRGGGVAGLQEAES